MKVAIKPACGRARRGEHSSPGGRRGENGTETTDREEFMFLNENRKDIRGAVHSSNFYIR